MFVHSSPLALETAQASPLFSMAKLNLLMLKLLKICQTKFSNILSKTSDIGSKTLDMSSIKRAFHIH